jgi:hypothetical protein
MERENARRLDAEVRGFVEELRLGQDAQRDVPSQMPRLELGDLENAATGRKTEGVEIQR